MLEGKTALVTGVSSGIGQAIATTLVKHGVNVFGVSRRAENIPEGVQHIPADLSQDHEIDAVFAELSHLDILVNNAGLALLSKISDGKPKDWEKMWKINVHALAVCCQKSLPLFSNTGTIVNISSLSGHRVPPTGGFYSPTKHAVSAITTALRNELAEEGSKIRVASISPGFVNTPLLDKYFQGREEQLEKTRQSIQMLSAQDIAEAVIYAVSAPTHVVIENLKVRAVDQAG